METGLPFKPTLGDPDSASGEEFRMSEFKVRRCARGRSHDWTECLYVHPSENASFPRVSEIRLPLSHESSLIEKDAPSFFHQMVKMQPQKYQKSMEMRWWKTGRRAKAKVSDFSRVETMLNRLNPEIVSRRLIEPYDEDYKKAKSEVPRLFMYYAKHEIKMIAELLKKMLQEMNDNGRFTDDWGYKELMKLSEYLLDFIEKRDSALLEKRAAESSGAKVEPQSKGVVSKTNALRKEDDSQRDDPEELFINLVELETTLEECVFRLPQHPSFIAAAAGYTPVLVF